ncbi:MULTISPECIES: dimethylamine monooxygenase subunit DmmA family protein [unclassified Acinetobacter]|uniref:dimethylamine monooxygenase subunit DmmA family protein n=1 Tax=unclassified Acinetobacter TaxID=196816 RepID=UPI0029344F63|nr:MULTISPECIES: dimethylamine monooxygenase subunit DmmA family protein [unclassified Acinetobacter]WOE32457.1 dimethylamine monooxygenase subunit DmmA family protein [Acinetobacter sp. SAAs470]WOE37932.1 dimethylamine monooxygenase subunit DmmA family protein [Acinetobacter sp. SAAs474]
MEIMHSTPKYLSLDTFHLNVPTYILVLENATSPYAQQLFQQLKVQQCREVFTLDNQRKDDALANLLNQLQDRLCLEYAGIHIVVCGTEAFIWEIQQCLIYHGCLKEEMSLLLDLTEPKQNVKKIYCVHCGRTQHTTAVEYCTCQHCNLNLLIRSHFSERLGAYMGVCANVQQSQGAIS